MGIRKLYVGSDSENLDRRQALEDLGYDPNKYHVSKVEDGPSGGGEDSCYLTIELGESKESIHEYGEGDGDTTGCSW